MSLDHRYYLLLSACYLFSNENFNLQNHFPANCTSSVVNNQNLTSLPVCLSLSPYLSVCLPLSLSLSLCRMSSLSFHLLIIGELQLLMLMLCWLISTYCSKALIWTLKLDHSHMTSDPGQSHLTSDPGSVIAYGCIIESKLGIYLVQ